MGCGWVWPCHAGQALEQRPWLCDLHSGAAHCAFFTLYLQKSCTKCTKKIYLSSVLPYAGVRVAFPLAFFLACPNPLFSIERGEREQLCSRNREKSRLPGEEQAVGEHRAQPFGRPGPFAFCFLPFHSWTAAVLAERLLVYAHTARISNHFWDQ